MRKRTQAWQIFLSGGVAGGGVGVFGGFMRERVSAGWVFQAAVLATLEAL